MAGSIIETRTARMIRTKGDNSYVNQYELLSVLGEGMHGKVYLARDTGKNQRVAIKSMKRVDPHNRRLPKSNRPDAPPLSAQQETESKIRREIAVMKKCTHQNLVRLLEVIDDPGSKMIYLVMENLEGGEVKWRSREHDGPVLELSQIQRIMKDVTLGLEYLHHQGIIHRDIKPANLLWTAGCQSVKICDFGVSHFTGATAQQDPALFDEAGLSKIVGSPAFFAPEICYFPDKNGSSHPSDEHNAPPITKQIDIWALGVTFYCLLFGEAPWQGNTEYVMFRAICQQEFHVPEFMARDAIPTGGRERRSEGYELGWTVVDILERLLTKDQEKRITLADLKKISWIQNGVREPEKWIRETTPKKDARVIVTDEEAEGAIKDITFSWDLKGMMKRTANALKHLPKSLSRGSPRPTTTGEMTILPFTKTKQTEIQKRSPIHMQRQLSSRDQNLTPQSTPQSLSKGRAAKAADKLKRYTTFGNVSPSRSTMLPNDFDPRRRNSTAGLAPHHQSASDSASSRRSLFIPTSNAISQIVRRKSDSLQLPAAANQRALCRAPISSSSISPTPSPTTPEDQMVTGSSLANRLRQVVRSTSVKRSIKGKSIARASHDGGRTSVETLDVSRDTATDIEDENRFNHTMRASSWSSPRDPEDEDDRSFDISSDTAGVAVHSQDFNRSVVLLGAGGYIESPSTPDSVATSYTSAIIANGSSTSSGSTVRPQVDPAHHPPRVRSPLYRTYRSEDEDEGNSVFDTGSELDDDPVDIYEEGEDTLEVHTRRPSAVLSRSANASPLRR